VRASDGELIILDAGIGLHWLGNELLSNGFADGGGGKHPDHTHALGSHPGPAFFPTHAGTGLPDPSVEPIGRAFMGWKRRNQGMINTGDINAGTLIATNTGDPSVKLAYDAPFPDPTYKAGPLIMPQRVPVTIDYPGAAENAAAWEVFKRWEKPFLTSFSDSDRITAPWKDRFLEEVPGARNQPHSTIENAGHFLQEQKGEEWARLIVEFIQANPTQE